VRSTHGASWLTQNSSTTNQLNGVARSGSLLLATGKLRHIIDFTRRNNLEFPNLGNDPITGGRCLRE